MFKFNFSALFSKKLSLANRADLPLSINYPIEEQTTIFQQKGLSLILDYMNSSDYHEHRTLIREITYLIEATFNIIKDDYQYGYHILYENFPRIDNYIFSDYRKNSKLKNHIDKLILLSFSNRFSEDPKENLMSYYVFLEEIGFEVTIFFNDYYKMLVGKNIINIVQSYHQSDYQLVLHQLAQENMMLKPIEVNKLIVSALIEKELKS